MADHETCVEMECTSDQWKEAILHLIFFQMCSPVFNARFLMWAYPQFEIVTSLPQAKTVKTQTCS